jgi:hypothetical protein
MLHMPVCFHYIAYVFSPWFYSLFTSLQSVDFSILFWIFWLQAETWIWDKSCMWLCGSQLMATMSQTEIYTLQHTLCGSQLMATMSQTEIYTDGHHESNWNLHITTHIVWKSVDGHHESNWNLHITTHSCTPVCDSVQFIVAYSCLLVFCFF